MLCCFKFHSSIIELAQNMRIAANAVAVATRLVMAPEPSLVDSSVASTSASVQSPMHIFTKSP